MIGTKTALAMTGALLFAAPALSREIPDTPEAAFERYQTEINSHDFDQLAKDVIAQDATFVFTDKTHRGIAEVRAAFGATWSVIHDEVYTMSEPEWLARDRDSALVAFRYSYKGTTKDGKALAGGGRGTNLYRRTPAGWRLAYEHLSHDPKPGKGAQPAPPTATRAGRVQLLEERLAAERKVASVRSVSVTFEPGQAGSRHRHPVPVFGYVARGAVLFQVEGEPTRTLTEGQTFYEPADKTILHFDNASNDREAMFVAFYLLGPGETETVEFLSLSGAN